MSSLLFHKLQDLSVVSLQAAKADEPTITGSIQGVSPDRVFIHKLNSSCMSPKPSVAPFFFSQFVLLSHLTVPTKLSETKCLRKKLTFRMSEVQNFKATETTNFFVLFFFPFLFYLLMVLQPQLLLVLFCF